MDLYLAAGTSNGSMNKVWRDFINSGETGGVEVLDLYLAGGINGNCKPM